MELEEKKNESPRGKDSRREKKRSEEGGNAVVGSRDVHVVPHGKNNARANVPRR